MLNKVVSTHTRALCHSLPPQTKAGERILLRCFFIIIVVYWFDSCVFPSENDNIVPIW